MARWTAAILILVGSAKLAASIGDGPRRYALYDSYETSLERRMANQDEINEHALKMDIPSEIKPRDAICSRDYPRRDNRTECLANVTSLQHVY